MLFIFVLCRDAFSSFIRLMSDMVESGGRGRTPNAYTIIGSGAN